MTKIDTISRFVKKLHSLFKKKPPLEETISSTVTREQFETATPPRVFISYTGIDENNAAWVKSLATKLRKNGVEAHFAEFDLKPGSDMLPWMTNEIIMADKVLLICDRYYKEKADSRSRKGGVGWETRIIQDDIFTRGDNNRKYIPIVREDDVDEALPIYMKSKYAFNWGKGETIDAECLKELVLCLFECDTKPELGAIPDYVK